jgi:Uma2 family endonuclease
MLRLEQKEPDLASLRPNPRDVASTQRLPPLQPGEHLDQPTFHARYEAMPKEVRAELIGGIVYMPSPLRSSHGDCHSEIQAWLTIYKGNSPGTRALVDSTLILGPDDEVQPDACLLVLPEYHGQTREENDYILGAPELVVEVALSSEAYDLHVKRRAYERVGVREYIVVILRERVVTWFVREEETFVSLPAGPDGIFRSSFFGGLWLDPEALLRGDTLGWERVLRAGLASQEHAEFVKRQGAEGA